MVYNTQNHWVSGLCSLSENLNTRKHNVSENESVSVFRWRMGNTYSVGTLRNCQHQSLDKSWHIITVWHLTKSKGRNTEICSRSCGETCTEWNRDTNGADNLCQKSTLQTRSNISVWTWIEYYHLHLYHSSILFMFHHNFYCILFSYLSSTQSRVRSLHGCYKTGTVQWLRLVLSKGPNRQVSPSPRLKTETDPDVFSSYLGLWTTD
jgi:hypothetical protein